MKDDITNPEIILSFDEKYAKLTAPEIIAVEEPQLNGGKLKTLDLIQPPHGPLAVSRRPGGPIFGKPLPRDDLEAVGHIIETWLNASYPHSPTTFSCAS